MSPTAFSAEAAARVAAHTGSVLRRAAESVGRRAHQLHDAAGEFTRRASAFVGDHADRAHHAAAALVEHVGYGSTFWFMCLESTFLPVAAEIGLIPAGMDIASGKLWWPTVLAVALAGSLVGSAFNYLLGRTLPRATIERLLGWLRVPANRYVRVEKALVDNAGLMVFWGRFIPGVRHVVAIPAGILRVPARRFFVATLAGELFYVPTYLLAGFLSGGVLNQWTLVGLTAATAVTSCAGILAARNRFSSGGKN